MSLAGTTAAVRGAGRFVYVQANPHPAMAGAADHTFLVQALTPASSALLVGGLHGPPLGRLAPLSPFAAARCPIRQGTRPQRARARRASCGPPEASQRQ